MRVLGVDPGTSATGWGVLETAEPRFVRIASGVVSVPSRLGRAERLRRIHTGIGELIARHSPDSVSLEQAFVSRNVQSAFRIGEARGVVLLAAAESGLEIFEYAPATIKKTVVGFGGADKAQMTRGIAMLLGIDPPDRSDEADALAIALCHLVVAGSPLARLEDRAR